MYSTTTYKEFTNTLQNTIKPWSYFVDFDKVNKNIKGIEHLLRLLNPLLFSTENEIDKELIRILTKYPETRRVFPLLIALRDETKKGFWVLKSKKHLLTKNVSGIFNPEIPFDLDVETEFLAFFQDSGLRHFFLYEGIESLADYCRGIEVGLDTNARKNRSGFLMEDIIEEIISSYCADNNCSYMRQATSKNILKEWNIEVNLDKAKRTVDFAILLPDSKICFIETNFYSSSGSKIKATEKEYETLNTVIKAQNMDFIWISDGLGWRSEKSVLEQGLKNIGSFLNITLFKEHLDANKWLS